MEKQGIKSLLGLSLHWESGTTKEICVLKDDNISTRLCGDFTIYNPLNEPYLVVEVAFCQSKKDVENKVKSWLTIPHLVGIVVVVIEENPAYRVPQTISPSSRLTKEEWLGETLGHPKFGPFRVRGHQCVGAFQVNMTVYRPKFQTVIAEEVNLIAAT
jgi:hypothetical protein